MPALLVDASSATVLAATHGSSVLLGRGAQSLVGSRLADLLGARATAELLAGKTPTSIRLARPDGLTLYLIAQCASATDDQLVVLLEDLTELWLGRAVAQAMVGLLSARAEATSLEDYVQRCVEAVVVAALAARAAIFEWRVPPQPMVARGSLGWSATELADIAAALSAHPRLSSDGQLWPDTILAPTAGGTADTDLAQVGFLPLTAKGKPVGVLVLQPFSTWLAASGHQLLERAIGEGLSEASPHPTTGREPMDLPSQRAALSAESLDILIRFLGCLAPGLPFSERIQQLMETLHQLVPCDQMAILGEVAEAFVAEFTYPPSNDVLPKNAVISSSDLWFLDAAANGQIVSDRLRYTEECPISQTLLRRGMGPWAAVPLPESQGRLRVLLTLRRAEDSDFAPDELRLLRVAAELMAHVLSERQPRPIDSRHYLLAVRATQVALARARMEAARSAAAFFMSQVRALETALQEALEASRGTPAEDTVLRAVEVLQRYLRETARLEACWDPLPGDAAEPVSLAEVVNEAVQAATSDLAATAPYPLTAYPITVEITTRGQILGRRDRLVQAVRALLDNAFQAMPHGGRLTVRLDRCGSWIRLLVADTGTGIVPALWDNIFQPFFTTFGVRHAGLGLTLVEGVVAKHKGVTLVCSDVCEGTTVAVYFPARAEGH